MIKSYFLLILFLLALFSSFLSCFSSKEELNKDQSHYSNPIDEDSGTITLDDSIQIAINLERIPGTGLDDILVRINLLNNEKAVSDAELSPIISKGSLGDITNKLDGNYEFTITPENTGEYKITINYKEQTLTKTALVLQDVHSDWGQAQAVSGYVNTEGYEDGVTITPDGEYLFVQTGPYRWSSLLVYSEARANGGCGGDRLSPDKCTHPWINEITGTLTAPKRPGFFTGRFSGTTQLHNAASWGVGTDQAPNYAMTTMFYGFKKQSDGSFKEPFYMAFNDLEDGIVGPFGLSFLKNQDESYTTIFSMADSFTTSFGFDIYTYTASFGSNNNLGDYELSSIGNPPNRGSNFPSSLVDLGDNTGTQGNPFLYTLNSEIKSIWTDDEYDNDADTHKLSLYILDSGSFPSSGAWTKILLPDNVNRAGKEAIQPTFTGDGLYYTEETSIVFANYSGAHNAVELANNAKWSLPSVIIQKDTTITSIKSDVSDIGKIIALGEPTIASVNGKEILYFVYAYIRSLDPITGYADLDFQAGFIEKK